MKKSILCFCIVSMLFLTACVFTELFTKGAEKTEELRIKLNTEFAKLDEKIQPIAIKYEGAEQLYEKGMRLYVQNFDELKENPEAKWIMTERWENLGNDIETQNLLITIRLTAEDLNKDFKPAYDIYIKVKNTKNKTEEDLIKLRDAFEKMATMSKNVSVFFESASKIISKVF